MCFFHKWTKWADSPSATVEWKDKNNVTREKDISQERNCTKCGKKVYSTYTLHSDRIKK